MINTYNESSLHKAIKTIYAVEKSTEQVQYCAEVEVCGFICDLVHQTTIIEIQTGNLSKLQKKINKLIDNFSICVVFPIIAEKKIIMRDANETTLYSRKSPIKNNYYAVFDELTGIYPFLVHDNFRLELLLVAVEEIRLKTEEPVQLPNKSRTWKKKWIKTDKKLIAITEKLVLQSKNDYLELLQNLRLPPIFCAKDIQKTVAKKYAHIMVWVLKKMHLIEEVKKSGRTIYYQITT